MRSVVTHAAGLAGGVAVGWLTGSCLGLPVDVERTPEPGMGEQMRAPSHRSDPVPCPEVVASDDEHAGEPGPPEESVFALYQEVRRWGIPPARPVDYPERDAFVPLMEDWFDDAAYIEVVCDDYPCVAVVTFDGRVEDVKDRLVGTEWENSVAHAQTNFVGEASDRKVTSLHLGLVRQPASPPELMYLNRVVNRHAFALDAASWAWLDGEP